MIDFSLYGGMRAHAIRRFNERTGATLTRGEYESLCASIRDHNPPAAAVTREGIRFYKVRIRGVTAYALWKRGQIATFYPSLDWITARGGRVLMGEAA